MNARFQGQKVYVVRVNLDGYELSDGEVAAGPPLPELVLAVPSAAPQGRVQAAGGGVGRGVQPGVQGGAGPGVPEAGWPSAVSLGMVVRCAASASAARSALPLPSEIFSKRAHPVLMAQRCHGTGCAFFQEA